jgi:hypothetical protein
MVKSMVKKDGNADVTGGKPRALREWKMENDGAKEAVPANKKPRPSIPSGRTAGASFRVSLS